MLIIGHRGCKYAKENTLDAFKCAIDCGVDMLELDIQPSKDMEIVVCHDINCERLTPLKGLVRNTNYKKLKKFNVFSLNDVLELTKFAKNIKLYIEFKGSYNETFLKKVIFVLRNCKKNNIYLASFNYKYFIKLLDYKKNCNIGYITCNNYKFINRIEEADFISFHHEFIDNDVANHFKKIGLNIFIYTINRKSILLNIIKYEPDGIISDVPNHIISWLNSTNQHIK